MKRFPQSVRNAMRASSTSTTCLPVKLERDEWETAFFLQLAGPECKEDRRILSKTDAPVPVGIETDLIEDEHAAVVVLRAEVFTLTDDPLAGEMLLVPGEHPSHFDAIRLLSRQPRLCWFFGDREFWLLHSQAHPLGTSQHSEFDELLRDAVKHDTLIRCTGRYDAQAALSKVVSRYELRAGILRTEYRSQNWRRGRYSAD